MTMVVYRYPVRTLSVEEPLFIRRAVVREAEELLSRISGPLLSQPLFNGGLNVEEKKDRVVVKGEMPGFKKSDLDITVEGDRLTVKGERKEQKENRENGVYTFSSSFGSYHREMALPAHVDGKNGSFKLTRGKLEIKLPKAEKASRRQIKIKAQAPRKRQIKARAGTAKTK